MAERAERTYVCAYNKCLHHGEKIPKSQAVVDGNKRYHLDCLMMKSDIAECVSMYLEIVGDKTLYPAAQKIVNTMVFKNMVPVSFIKKKIEESSLYYKDKPVHALYGIKRLFWEKEFKA